MSLTAWSSVFLVLYIAGMLGLGLVANRQIKGADDFATARRSYGPFFLALAFSATIASGATFLGFPGMAYEAGISATWGLLYPVGVFIGVCISMRMVSSAGHRWKIRSMPEFLGRRYQSEGIRILVALASLLLFFYLAGQLLAGLVMFEIMLGLPAIPSLMITVVIMLAYVSMGGAHADILTDGFQGLLMLLIAGTVIAMFALGSGVDGGFVSFLDKLEKTDPNLTMVFNEQYPHFRSWWSALALIIACVPMGCLPHVGNKLWALKDDRQRIR
ncbi:MAG TPA: sodium:pantothenate symporter, partial [Planctomycetaceae bacterium]|nr:sodium:pantothenate symporter [Planctomycetaceae bacterium]